MNELINCTLLLSLLVEKHIERTSVVGSSNVQSLGMHKKSIEAAKALKDEDGSCDGDANSSESEKPHHQQPLAVSSSAGVMGNLDRRQAPPSGRQSVDPSAGGVVEDALRSESIAALRAKV